MALSAFLVLGLFINELGVFMYIFVLVVHLLFGSSWKLGFKCRVRVS